MIVKKKNKRHLDSLGFTWNLIPVSGSCFAIYTCLTLLYSSGLPRSRFDDDIIQDFKKLVKSFGLSLGQLLLKTIS